MKPHPLWYRILFCGIIALGSASSAQGQVAAVRGFITDGEDGQPLQGVHVVLERSGRLIAGSVTDKDGFYAVSRLPAGQYTVRATFIGYEPYEASLQLGAGEIRLLNLALAPTEAELGEVVVESDRQTGVARVTAGQMVARPADIERIPTPDVSGDLATYLTTIPGIVTIGDRGGQLFIRGGEPWQNLVLLDGMLVYQPFHILGFFSSFPSDMVNRVDVYAGGFGGRFGGRISSVIDVAARNGNKRNFTGTVSIAPFVSGIQVEGPLSQDRVSFLVSARRSVIREGAARLVDEALPFRFGDFFAKLHATVNRNNQLSFSALRTYDGGDIGEDVGGKPPEQVRWTNEAYGLRYLISPNNFPLLAEFLINASRLKTDFGPEEAPTRDSEVGRVSAEANITYYAGRAEVNWGLFARTLKMQSELGGVFQNVVLQEEFVTEVGLYLEPDVRVHRTLRMRGGLRLHGFPSKGRGFFEPRFRVVWNRGPHQISGGFGVYHQEVVGLNDRRDAASVFTAWAATPFARVPRATHFLLGYQVRPTSWLDVSLEGYYKDLANLFVPEWTAFPRFTTRLQPADGTVRGLDLRLEFRRPSFYGYITYGLSSVLYDARQPSLQVWYGVNAFRFRPPHDRRHQVNALASTTVRGVNISLRWQFGSGLPFNRAIGFDGFVLLSGPVDVFQVPGSRRVIYERPFNGVLPTYHRLDFSVDRTFPLKHADLTVQASIINLYDRQNLFFLDVFTLRRVDQLPLIPSFGVKIEFK